MVLLFLVFHPSREDSTSSSSLLVLGLLHCCYCVSAKTYYGKYLRCVDSNCLASAVVMSYRYDVVCCVDYMVIGCDMIRIC